MKKSPKKGLFLLPIRVRIAKEWAADGKRKTAGVSNEKQSIKFLVFYGFSCYIKESMSNFLLEFFGGNKYGF